MIKLKALKLYHLERPDDSEFARQIIRGTWVDDRLCSKCRRSLARRVPPLRICWHTGYDQIGDFTISSVDCVITERVKQAWEGTVQGFVAKDVIVEPNPDIERAKHRRRRVEPHVPYPYRGPQLYDLWIEKTAPMDLERSTVEMLMSCDACGLTAYYLIGVETPAGQRDLKSREFTKTHQPRIPGKGIYIAAEHLPEPSVFRLAQMPNYVLCDERVKVDVEERSFTNIQFLEVGETF